MADVAASVLAKLKNKAKSSGISYQQCLQLFFQEEFLRRLAASKYAQNLVLKGGLFIYTLTNFESRATVDVDFLLRQLPGTVEDVKKIVDEIIAVDCGNDFITFTSRGFEMISPQRKYKGQHRGGIGIGSHIKAAQIVAGGQKAAGKGDDGEVRAKHRRIGHTQR